MTAPASTSAEVADLSASPTVTRTITVIGCDGSPLRPAAAEALSAASLVAGGSRHLAAAALPPGVETLVLGDVTTAVQRLLAHEGQAVVLASGDPGFFGILRRLQACGAQVAVHPAVSSVALAFARVGLAWEGARVVSAHGRDPRPALAVVRAGGTVAVLTDAVTGPAEVAAAAPGAARIVVCERLGELDEQVVCGTPAQIAGRDRWAQPNVVLVLPSCATEANQTAGPDSSTPRGAAPAPPWQLGPEPAPGWALSDDAFDHRDGMVTKAEVRALVLARLAPRPGTVVWDVGAGSGSVAVECARLGSASVAVERDLAQCERITVNAGRHGVHVHVVAGAAPRALHGLADPDAVFVGGGGPAVVAAVAGRGVAPQLAHLRPVDRVVVALAAVERVGPTVAALADAGYEVAGTQLQASRLAALPDGTHRLAATNPVLLVWGERR